MVFSMEKARSNRSRSESVVLVCDMVVKTLRDWIGVMGVESETGEDLFLKYVGFCREAAEWCCGGATRSRTSWVGVYPGKPKA